MSETNSTSLVCCSLVQERRRIFEEWASRNAKNQVHHPKGINWKYKSRQNLLDTDKPQEKEVAEDYFENHPSVPEIKSLPSVPPKPPRTFEFSSQSSFEIKTPTSENCETFEYETIENEYVFVDESESVVSIAKVEPNFDEQINNNNKQDNNEEQPNETNINESETKYEYQEREYTEQKTKDNWEHKEFEVDDEFDLTDEDEPSTTMETEFGYVLMIIFFCDNVRLDNNFMVTCITLPLH